jgi:hypothetical protein
MPSARRFPPPWTVEDMTADRPMTAEQAATLKRLAEAAYELEAFQPNLTRAEADLRIAMLTDRRQCHAKSLRVPQASALPEFSGVALEQSLH